MVNNMIDTKDETKELIGQVREIYLKLYNGIMNKDLSNVKKYLSMELYHEYNNLINNLYGPKEKQMYEDIEIVSTRILKTEEINDKKIITISLVSKYKNYIINTETDKVTAGNCERKVEKDNIITLVKFLDDSNIKILVECSNCGATIDISENEECEYCHTINKKDDIEFVFTSLLIK